MTKMNDDVTVYKAPQSLRAKVGNGNVSDDTLSRVNEIVAKKSVDFVPMAQELLTQMSLAISFARKNKDKAEAISDINAKILSPVMGLKSNASMFGYPLIGDLANIMQSFIESLDKLDESAIQIIEASHKTWMVIVSKEMQGDGAQYGAALKSELKQVCERYLKKQAPRSTKTS